MTWFLTHLATVVGSLLSILAIAHMLRQRRSPSSTAAWLLAIIAVPYLGVPLFLMFGGRKLRRRAEAKEDLGLIATQAIPLEKSNYVDRTLRLYGIPGATDGNRMTLCATGVEGLHAMLATGGRSRSLDPRGNVYLQPRRGRSGRFAAPGQAGRGRAGGALAGGRRRLAVDPAALLRAFGPGRRQAGGLQSGASHSLCPADQSAEPSQDRRGRRPPGDGRRHEHHGRRTCPGGHRRAHGKTCRSWSRARPPGISTRCFAPTGSSPWAKTSPCRATCPFRRLSPTRRCCKWSPPDRTWPTTPCWIRS